VTHTFGQPWRLDLCLRQGAWLRSAAVRAFPAYGWPLVPDVEDTPLDAFQTRPTSLELREVIVDMADALATASAWEAQSPGDEEETYWRQHYPPQ